MVRRSGPHPHHPWLPQKPILTWTPSVYQNGDLIAERRRKWARQLTVTVTDPRDVARAAELRPEFQAQRARRPAFTPVLDTASLARNVELFSVDLGAAPAL